MIEKIVSGKLDRVSMPNHPRLMIEHSVWQKLRLYISCSGRYEINGFGYISYDGVDFWLKCADDLFITKQVVTPGSVTVSGSVFAMATYQATLDGRHEDLRLQWHSHVDFDACFSSTDITNIKSYGKVGIEWFVSLVMNKSDELSARLDCFRPIRYAVPLEVVTYVDDDGSLTEKVKHDISEKVEVKGPLPRRNFIQKGTDLIGG